MNDKVTKQQAIIGKLKDKMLGLLPTFYIQLYYN